MSIEGWELAVNSPTRFGEDPEFVVLPYEEFIIIKEELESYEDLKDFREAKENSKHEESIPLSKVVKDLDLK